MATAEGVFPKTGNDPLYASEVNAFHSYGWHKIIYDGNINLGLIKFSDTRWQTSKGLTTDSGDNWSAGGYDAVSAEDIATSYGTDGLAADSNDASTSISSDSGANWTASTTMPSAGNMTDIYCMSLFGNTAVVGGDAGANESIYYSSDKGDNFSEADSGPTDEVFAIVMANEDIGYAVSGGSKIYKTTNSGQSWTDTEDTHGLFQQGMRIYAIDTDTILLVDKKGNVEKYVSSTNTITVLTDYELADSSDSVSNIVKATNGNYYWVRWTSAIGTNQKMGLLTLLKYDGTNVYQRPIAEPGFIQGDTYWNTNTFGTINCFIEGAENILYLNMGLNHLLEISVKGD